MTDQSFEEVNLQGSNTIPQTNTTESETSMENPETTTTTTTTTVYSMPMMEAPSLDGELPVEPMPVFLPPIPQSQLGNQPYPPFINGLPPGYPVMYH